MIKPSTGGVARVSDGRFTVQQTKSKLKSALDEWILDPTIGLLSIDDFNKNISIQDIELRALEIILGTQGVQSVIYLRATYSNRILTISFDG